jgi:hypothetical protein
MFSNQAPIQKSKEISENFIRNNNKASFNRNITNSIIRNNNNKASFNRNITNSFASDNQFFQK